MSGTAIIIPCKNEEKSIQGLLDQIDKFVPDAEIIIIDDNSENPMPPWIQNSKQIHYLRSSNQLGIGGAVQLGIRYAFNLGIKKFVRIDGDGQHPPEFIGKLLEILGQNTIVRGARSAEEFTQSSTKMRRMGSRYFEWLFKIILKVNYPDPTSGFCCFDREVAKKFIQYFPLDYPEIEIGVLLVKAGVNIRHMNVKMNSRSFGKSSINILHTCTYFFSVTIAFCISIIKKNPYIGKINHGY